MRRLIVKLSSIGDVIHTIPAYRALRSFAPRDFIAWVVEEPAHPILVGMGGLDRVFLLPRQGWRVRRGTAGKVLDLFSEMRKMRFHQVIDFQGLARSGIVALLSGATERVGFRDGREGSPLLYHRRVRVAPGDRHAVDRNLGLVRALGASARGGDPGLSIPPRARDRVELLLRQEGLRNGYVVLHPSAGRVTNRYPPERFAALGDGIVRELELAVVVTGSGSDRGLVQQVVDSMRCRAVDLSGRLDLWDLAALSSASACFVGGDTGPLHLATAVGARVVAIYGGAKPEMTGPYGSSARLVRSHVPCGRCYRRSCPDLPCMGSISPAAGHAGDRHLVGSARGGGARPGVVPWGREGE